MPMSSRAQRRDLLNENEYNMELYKYQGAGNDFLIADNRSGSVTVDDGCLLLDEVSSDGNAQRRRLAISELCDRRYGIGADGLMLLENADGPDEGTGADFRMVYFNSDGSGGMMCGNGGRCIVAFAADLGITSFCFVAADGFHPAEILSASGREKTVRLKMKDVYGITTYGKPGSHAGLLDGYFLDTGTRHFVKPVSGLSEYDVFTEGRTIRSRDEFAPIGTNVNFVQPCGNVLHVRTYEKGVEDETYACGTGITASAIAIWHHVQTCGEESASDCRTVVRTRHDGRVYMDIKALRDTLAVDFIPTAYGAEDVWLTGPATYVAKIMV